MEIRIKKVKIKIEFSFLLLISVAMLYGYENALALLVCAVLHELGHFFFLLVFKTVPYYIVFSFYGIGIKYENKLSRAKELIVILAGPMVNLLLYLIFKDNINLALFFINILPVYPLDGGRVIYLFSRKASKIVGIIFILLLFLLSIYNLIINKSFSLLLITIYLFCFGNR